MVAQDHIETKTVFSEFHQWNQVPSLIILWMVIISGTVANSFIFHCIYWQKIGTDYINPVLLAISIKNAFAIATCIPLATMMLSLPTTIQFATCIIQENVTFVVLFAGFLFPAVLSIVQCDHILRPHNLLIGETRIKLVLCFVPIAAILLGLQSEMQRDFHGCHLWSYRVDAVVLTYIYTIGLVSFLALATIVTCYMLIYKHTRDSRATVTKVQGQLDNTFYTETSTRHPRDKAADKIKNYVHLRQKVTTAILKPMFAIVFTGVISTLPWVVLYSVTLQHELWIYAELRILAMSLMYVPIAADPIIFLLFSTKGRYALKSILRKKRPVVDSAYRYSN